MILASLGALQVVCCCKKYKMTKNHDYLILCLGFRGRGNSMVLPFATCLLVHLCWPWASKVFVLCSGAVTVQPVNVIGLKFALDNKGFDKRTGKSRKKVTSADTTTLFTKGICESESDGKCQAMLWSTQWAVKGVSADLS